MKFIPELSLEHMALVEVSASLWNHNDIRYLMVKLGSRNQYVMSAWVDIENVVIEKVSALPLPKLLKEKVLHFIKPIGIQILEYMEFNFQNYDMPLYLPAEFCWTPHGTIDRKRTVKLLVKDEHLDICTRYKLACIYCLEDDIQKFWNNFPVSLKDSLCQEPKWDGKSANIIITNWSSQMKEKTQVNYKDEFQNSVKYGNYIAAAYFLQKLTSQQRQISLAKAGKSVRNNDVLYFLISEMNEQRQMKLFRQRPYYVLQCFLQWPLQSFFLEVADLICGCLSKEKYSEILYTIDSKLTAGYKDWDYRTLFIEFCQRSPGALKSLYITDIHDYLLSWSDMEDEEKIRLIFKDTTFKARKKFIYGDEMNTYLVSAIHQNNWNFLKFIIQEYFPSEKEMLKFKKVFEKRTMDHDFQKHFSKNKRNWESVFDLSGNSNFKINIRNVEEGESSAPKRLRRLQ